VEGDFAEVFDVSKLGEPVSFEISNKNGASTTLNKNF